MPGRGRRDGRPEKVFVGGVPQDMTEEALSGFFRSFGVVKQAWLQCHRNAARGQGSRPQNHRGFGFVIFGDKASVEALLGPEASRILALPDGRKLEVKRAVSSDRVATQSPASAQLEAREAPVAPVFMSAPMVMQACGRAPASDRLPSMMWHWPQVGFSNAVAAGHSPMAPQLGVSQPPVIVAAPMHYTGNYAFPQMMAMAQHYQHSVHSDPMQQAGAQMGPHMMHTLQIGGPHGVPQAMSDQSPQ